MLMMSEFEKVKVGHMWQVHDRYSVSFEPDFESESEQECDEWINKTYEDMDKQEDLMMEFM